MFLNFRLQDSPDRHRGILRWQEVPLHQRRFHPWKNLQVSCKSRDRDASWLHFLFYSFSYYLLIIISSMLMALLLFWLGALSSIPKCRGRSLSDAITCTISRSTTGSRSAIRLCQCTARPPSVSRPVMSWLSASAVPSPRPSASMSSARRSSTSRVTSRRFSFSSEWLHRDLLDIASY